MSLKLNTSEALAMYEFFNISEPAIHDSLMEVMNAYCQTKVEGERQHLEKHMDDFHIQIMLLDRLKRNLHLYLTRKGLLKSEEPSDAEVEAWVNSLPPEKREAMDREIAVEMKKDRARERALNQRSKKHKT